EHSTHRSCSVRPPLQSPRQLLKVFLQVLPVVTPRLCIYPWRGISLQREECRAQSLDVVDMVQQRGEPLFLIISCYLSYPLERALRAFPALRPERVAFLRVPLGPTP